MSDVPACVDRLVEEYINDTDYTDRHIYTRVVNGRNFTIMVWDRAIEDSPAPQLAK